jgi:hypothetical protein
MRRHVAWRKPVWNPSPLLPCQAQLEAARKEVERASLAAGAAAAAASLGADARPPAPRALDGSPARDQDAGPLPVPLAGGGAATAGAPAAAPGSAGRSPLARGAMMPPLPRGAKPADPLQSASKIPRGPTPPPAEERAGGHASALRRSADRPLMQLSTPREREGQPPAAARGGGAGVGAGLHRQASGSSLSSERCVALWGPAAPGQELPPLARGLRSCWWPMPEAASRCSAHPPAPSPPPARSFRRSSLQAPTPQSARPAGVARTSEAVPFAKFMASGPSSARSSGTWGGDGGGGGGGGGGGAQLASRPAASARPGSRWK